MDRLEFDLLFRWFVGLGVDDAAWDHSTFSKNRERLFWKGDIAAKLLGAVSFPASRVNRLLSADHFSVDGTLIEAWGFDGRVFGSKSLSSGEDPEERLGRSSGGRRRAEPRGGFSRPEALERDARFDDRSGRASLSQGAGHKRRSSASWATR